MLDPLPASHPSIDLKHGGKAVRCDCHKEKQGVFIVFAVPGEIPFRVHVQDLADVMQHLAPDALLNQGEAQ